MKNSITADFISSNAIAIDVDFEGCKTINSGTAIEGTVSIETANGMFINLSGEHGLNDYFDDYGFIIKINS